MGLRTIISLLHNIRVDTSFVISVYELLKWNVNGRIGPVISEFLTFWKSVRDKGERLGDIDSRHHNTHTNHISNRILGNLELIMFYF